MSNFPLHNHGRTECRAAQPDEVDAALRMLLSPLGYATDQQVADFLNFAGERGIDVTRIWIAVRDRVVRWALLPVVSPGRTMLLFTPTRFGRQTDLSLDIRPLVNAICADQHSRGVDLAQMLIEPADRPMIDAYTTCGFTQLAELIYLQRALRRPGELPPPPQNFFVENYSPQTHALFAQAIQESYQSSLDCPGLNGLRSIHDVITGHQHAGAFDPSLWFVLRERSRDAPAGVLLLSRAHYAGAGAIELVYLGLVPELRGRGLGDWLMRLAITKASQATAGRGYLTLAVDAQNVPALNLYYRHGLSRVGTRVALLRDLR